MIIDCHTHTFLSDGVLLPSELIKRCEDNGYSVLAITDHVDKGNVEFVLSSLIPAIETANKYSKINILPGVELTHVHPKGISECVKIARDNGAKVVVVHGETPVENVYKGTNEAAIKARCDILAHPGRLSLETAKLAADYGVMLEITARRGSCLSNGHVLKVCRESGADFVVNTDAHSPEDIFTANLYKETAFGCGMTQNEFHAMLERLHKWIQGLK